MMVNVDIILCSFIFVDMLIYKISQCDYYIEIAFDTITDKRLRVIEVKMFKPEINFASMILEYRNRKWNISLC